MNVKVPFVDLRKQYEGLRKEIENLLNDIFDNTAYICGKYVALFENAFAVLHGFKHFIGVNSGTSAVHLMLWASGIERNDEVVIPVNTFIATAEAISLCGATPVFVDVDINTYNINYNELEKVVSKRTKAIIPVHLYGLSANMSEILKFAREKEISIFEDACQAHYAAYKGTRVGNFGIAGAFSFYPGKNIGAFGEAGGVSVNSEELYIKMKKMRDHGSEEKYKHELIGHNYRMEEIQAAVLYVKIKYLKNWIEQRRKIASYYKKYLSELEGVVCPIEPEDCYHVYHLFVIRVLNGKRNRLKNYLYENGIMTGLHYPIPLHLQKAYKSLGYKKGDFPVAEKIADEILSLPIYPELDLKQVEYVCDKIHQFFKKGQ